MKRIKLIRPLLVIILVVITYFIINAIGSMPFEKISPQAIDEKIKEESDFLHHISGYNYWKTSDGLVFVISDGPRGTPGYWIRVKSVKKAGNGSIKIKTHLTEPPKNVNNVQMVMYPIAYIKLRAIDGDFDVVTQQGGSIPRIEKNEFVIKGTISYTDAQDGRQQNPTFIKLLPGSVENNPLFSHFRSEHDEAYFKYTTQSGKHGRLLKNGDRVEITYYIDMGEANIILINKI